MMEIIDRNLRKTDVRNVLREDYFSSVVKKIKCLHCSDLNSYCEKGYSLNIELPENP